MLLTILIFFLNSVLAKDYCKLCENGTHTMCQFKEGPADNCIGYTEMLLTASEKMYILDIHNDIRNQVASGKEYRGVLGNQPSAADMFLLEWDEELANIAQRWVDQCISVNTTIQHDTCRGTEKFDVGQNIVTAITKDGRLPDLSILILNWYKQIMYIIPSDVDEFVGILRDKNPIGQYTQLVWAKTRFIGCAAAAFKETENHMYYNIRFLCNYGPSGNVIGESVYQRGEPCSKCPQRLCDRLRPNLCAGMNENVYIKKEKKLKIQKYGENATILSNLIDIDDPKFTTLRFYNPWILNKSMLTEKEIQRINTTFNNFLDIGNNFDSSFMINKTDKEYLNNTGYFTLNCTENGNCLNKSVFSYAETTLNYYNFTTSILEDEKNKYETNTTEPQADLNRKFAIKSYRYLKNLTLISRIQEIIYNIHRTITEKFVEDNTTPAVIDLTKSKCDREIKLENGIIIINECESESRISKPRNKKIPEHRIITRVTFDGNNLILPGNRHFRRANGIWHQGHCRCSRNFRSHSSRLTMMYSLPLQILFSCYISIKQYLYLF